MSFKQRTHQDASNPNKPDPNNTISPHISTILRKSGRKITKETIKNGTLINSGDQPPNILTNRVQYHPPHTDPIYVDHLIERKITSSHSRKTQQVNGYQPVNTTTKPVKYHQHHTSQTVVQDPTSKRNTTEDSKDFATTSEDGRITDTKHVKLDFHHTSQPKIKSSSEENQTTTPLK